MQRIITASHGDIFEPEDANQLQDDALGRAQVPGLMLGPPYVLADDAAFGLQITVGPITFMLMDNPNTTLTYAGGTLATTDPTLAANTMYHLFARNNAGAIGFEYVAHASGFPSGGMVFKNGDPTRRYITSFITRLAAPEVVPFHQAGAEYIYRRSLAVAAADLIVPGVTTVDAGSYTTISLARWLPAHARIAILDVRWEPGGAGNNGYLVTDGDTTDDTKAHIFEPVGTEVIHREIRIITNGSQAIAYKTTGTNTGSTQGFTITVVGYLANHA